MFNHSAVADSFSSGFVADMQRSKIKQPTIKEKFRLLQFYFTFIAVACTDSLRYIIT